MKFKDGDLVKNYLPSMEDERYSLVDGHDINTGSPNTLFWLIYSHHLQSWDSLYTENYELLTDIFREPEGEQ